MADGRCGGPCGGLNPVRGPGQRFCLSCHAAWMRDHRPAHADLSPERKLRSNARGYARVYRQRGKLVAVPCACGCGTPLDRLGMHHEDYHRPLDVVFCCDTEHKRLDAARFARLGVRRTDKQPAELTAAPA